MVYIALLRGINVGGKNKIDMKLLKQTFERVGMKDVLAYINTGNIILLSNSLLKPKLSRILEEAILCDFGLQIRVAFVMSMMSEESLMRFQTHGKMTKT